MAVAVGSMKKFLNDPDAVVKESLTGLAAAHGDLLRYDADAQIVVRADAPTQGKVALISGGGSGHEPLHGGFVGRGMLDAACPGEVFTSPVPDQMLAATKAVDGGAGVIHIVKNYTGDVMNFRLAAEMAEDEGIQVESVLTNDDVAVEDSTWTAGRRGVGVTVLVEKISGAKAEAGGSLAEVAAVARKVNDQGRSFGVALTSCATPAAGTPTFDIGHDEMEFGVGIHGELDPPAGSDVLAFVNGLGGTPLIELYLIYNELRKRLEQAGVQATRNLVGNYITSLEMAGASITLLT